MSKPVALVVRSPGTNRDHDVAYALELAGASAKRVSLNELRGAPGSIHQAQMLVLAGGFSNADALGAGTLAALQIATHLGDALREFLANGNPILGICNGFQMLVRSGLLPGSLTHNASGAFTCRWVTLETSMASSVWTAGITEPIECPVAHGEGRYLAEPEIVGAHSALTYIDDTNPNGSTANIAGVADATGLVLGLMPHPENHVLVRQHPQFTRRRSGETVARSGLGLPLFTSGVNYVKDRG
jgi:phosphoribosylformylglycinamidine synthase subunit PurQ / glutaminase